MCGPAAWSERQNCWRDNTRPRSPSEKSLTGVASKTRRISVAHSGSALACLLAKPWPVACAATFRIRQEWPGWRTPEPLVVQVLLAYLKETFRQIDLLVLMQNAWHAWHAWHACRARRPCSSHDTLSISPGIRARSPGSKRCPLIRITTVNLNLFHRFATTTKNSAIQIG